MTFQLGFHCGGVDVSVLSAAQERGATVVQVFLKDNQSTHARCQYTPEQTARIKDHLQRSGLEMVVHASYIINLAHSPTSQQAVNGIELIVDDAIHLAAMTPAKRIGQLVIHVGKSKTQAVALATENFITNAKRALARMPTNVRLLVETGAGQGTEMFTDLNELVRVTREIRRGLDPERVGICFDTCHVFSAGLDISKPDVMSRALLDLIETDGLLQLIHLNDSQLPCGSKRDRHESIGYGHLFDVKKGGSLQALHTLAVIAKSNFIQTVFETSGQYHQTEVRAVRCLSEIKALPLPSISWNDFIFSIQSTSEGTSEDTSPVEAEAGSKVEDHTDDCVSVDTDDVEIDADADDEIIIDDDDDADQPASLPVVKSVNTIIADILEKLGNSQTHPFKKKAYMNAVATIRSRVEPIKSGAQASRLPGVGKAMAEKIDEILKTGTLHQYEEKKRELDAIDQLTEVSGIGSATALKLFRDHGINTVPELVEAHKQKLIKLTKAQESSLTHYHDILQRIPREEMHLYAAEIEETAKAVEPSGLLQTMLVGSYRRGLASSGDIDVLMQHPSVQTAPEAEAKGSQLVDKILDELNKRGVLKSVLSKGKKAMIIVGLPGRPSRRMDILLTAADSYAAAILYFTGSKEFNVRMRITANNRGYKLNEYGLWRLDNEQLVPTKSEQEIFKTIGMKYVPPELR